MRTMFLLIGRHPGFCALLVAQIAIGFVLLCHAWQAQLAWRERQALSQVLPDTELTVFPRIQSADGGAIPARDIVTLLRTIPGVTHAAASNQSPYGATAWSSMAWVAPHREALHAVSVYMGSDLIGTLGLRLVQGRDFRAEEYRDYGGDQSRLHDRPASAVVSASLAQRLFPEGDAVGRSFHIHAEAPLRVVGVVEALPLPLNGRGGNEESLALILPVRMTDAASAQFLLRGPAPSRRETARDARRLLARAYPSAVIASPVGLSELRTGEHADQRRRTMSLWIVTATWWFATLGAVTMTGLRAAHLHRQELSLRRAVGATHGQVATAWQREYAALCVVGSLAGACVAKWLPHHLPMPPLRLGVLPLCLLAAAVLVCVLLAARWPVRAAANTSPHLVSRSPSVRL